MGSMRAVRAEGCPRALLLLAFFCSVSLTATSQTLSATTISFGNQIVQTTSTARTVTLKNNQTVPLTISSISASGDFAATSSCPLAPNPLLTEATCQITVTFTPTVLTSETSTLAVNDNASNSPQTVQLSGTGVPSVGISQTSYKFANQAVNTTSPAHIFTLTNYQTVPLTISGISLAGEFTSTSNCPLSPNTLAAKTGCTISVIFAPSTVGTLTGSLTVSDNAPNAPQTVQLSGYGLSPVVLSPPSFNFGSQSVGGTSTAEVFTLTNNQTAPLGISAISTSGEYAQTSNCPLLPNQLAANTACTISVTFTPTAAGAASSVLTVNDNAPNAPQTAPITGTGVFSVSLTPLSLSFPSEHPTTTSPAQTITVKNTQSGALTISGISTTGDFAQASNCPLSPNTLAGGGSCTVSVTFTPSALGTRSGTLVISDNAGTQSANLSGTGTLLGLSAISLTPLNPAMFTGGQQQLTATGTFANQSQINVTNFVNWSSSASASAQVSATGLVQAVGPGAALISARQGSVNGQTTVTVTAPVLTSITISPANASGLVGANQQFTAVLNYNNGTSKDSTSAVSWSSSSNAVATVSPSGLASGASAGTTTIHASLGSITGSTTLTVSQPSCAAAPPGLVGWWTGDNNAVDIVGSNSGTLQRGATYGTGEVAQAFAFGGNGASLLVNSSVYSPTAGTLMFWFYPTGPGALTGEYAGGQNRAPGFSIDSSGNLNWEFGNLSAQSVGQISFNQWNYVALTYSTSNSEAAVNVYLNGVLVSDTVATANTAWSPQVAFGAYLGAQQPAFAGSMDEIAISNQALNAQQIQQIYNAFSAGMCKPTLQSIAVNPASPSLAPGLSQQFDAVGSYSDTSTHDLTTSANWSTANPAVATINPAGIATAAGEGSTTVSATLGSLQGSTSLTVAPSLVSIQVNPQSAFSDIGTVQSFKAIGSFSNGSHQDLTLSVTWTTSTSSVATVAPNGQVTCLAAGQSTITAIAGSISGSSLLTVTSATLTSIALNPANPSVATGVTQQFTATGTFSDGTQQNLTDSVNWSSSATGVATIGATGTGTGVGAGQATITATLGSVTGAASLTVTTAVLTEIQLSPSSPSVIIGSGQQFSVTGIYSDGSMRNISSSVTWLSSTSTVATMSTSTQGLAVSTGTGETRISASFGGLDASTTLTVQDQLVSLSIAPSTASVPAQNSQQFTALGTYASGVTQNVTGSVSWSSSASGVASLSSSGLATTLTLGQTNIEASLGNVNATANLTVLPVKAFGQWSTLSTTMPINPIHVALLANGELLVVAGSGNCSPVKSYCPQGPPYGPSNGSGALLMQPGSWQVLNQFSVSWDMFCNGMVLLPDGRALIEGGTLKYDPFYGLPNASIYDPVANTFTNIGNTAHGRWYPTLLTLSDGTVMTFSGVNETGSTNNAVEFYTEATGWSTPYTAQWTPDTYPRLHLLPNGNVFYSGSLTSSKIFNPATATWTLNVANTNYGGIRTYGTSVLLPLTPANGYDPKVIIMGGGNPATNTTEIIDMGATTPAWQYGPNMSQPRIQMNAVILPNGKVLALGGSANNEDTTTASLNADLYDPASNTFSPAGANAYPRLYHSTALLLPDATVWLAGGNPMRGTYEQQMEIYQPAYLFNNDGTLATRPSIASTTSSISYGNTFNVSTPDAANISSVVLVRNGTVTHAFGMDQREVGLPFTVGNGSLTVTAPPNGNIAPPGYYMLFILNSSGVPSVAAFVQMTTSTSGSSVLATLPLQTATQSAPQSTVGGQSQAETPTRTIDQAQTKVSNATGPVEGESGRQTSSSDSMSAPAINVRGTWSGTFVSKRSDDSSFKMTVVIDPDSYGHLIGRSTLTSDCLSHALLQVTVTGSKIVLAGSDEAGDSITVHGTINKTGTLLKASYILEGSSSGRCETDDGTGTLAKH
jgi:hypothetical protein